MIKVALVGNDLKIEKYSDILSSFDEDMQVVGKYSDKINYMESEILDNTDSVFFLGTINESLLINAIKLVKHIFIEDYTEILNRNICKIRSIAQEAKVKIKISFPEIRRWHIEEICNKYKDIKHISFFKESAYTNADTVNSKLILEILASIKLMGEDVIRLDTKIVPMWGYENKSITLEFKTGSSARITNSIIGFNDLHELKISGKKFLTLFELDNNKWTTLTKNGNNFVKDVGCLIQSGNVEKYEVQSFIDSIKNNKDIFISLDDMCSLYNCMSLKE